MNVRRAMLPWTYRSRSSRSSGGKSDAFMRSMADAPSQAYQLRPTGRRRLAIRTVSAFFHGFLTISVAARPILTTTQEDPDEDLDCRRDRGARSRAGGRRPAGSRERASTGGEDGK